MEGEQPRCEDGGGSEISVAPRGRKAWEEGEGESVVGVRGEKKRGRKKIWENKEVAEDSIHQSSVKRNFSFLTNYFEEKNV